MPGEIMMVSMDFVEEPLELIDLFVPDFVMAMVFNSVDETLALLGSALGLGLVKYLKLKTEQY